MLDNIKTKVYVLGDNIDTDQIIPAGHLAISLSNPEEKVLYGKYALSGVPKGKAGLPYGDITFSNQETFKSEFGLIIAGNNFGCGSSREHAPFALAESGIHAVIACSFARIFFRNSIDGGYFPPIESEEDLSKIFKTNDEVVLNFSESSILHIESNKSYKLKSLGAAKEIILSGGIFNYAKEKGML